MLAVVQGTVSAGRVTGDWGDTRESRASWIGTVPSMKMRFLSAADSTRPLLDRPDLGERWERPSALERMTIGELTAHLSRAVTVVTRYLDTKGGPPFRDAADYFLSIFPEVDTDLDSEMGTGVRARAAREAGAGPDAVRTAWDRARQELETRLEEEEPGRGIAVRGSSMRIEDYLVTRLVELVIHADDLAASLDVTPPRFDPTVTEAVIECLIRIASRRHTPVAVIRAMSRTERGDPALLRVF